MASIDPSHEKRRLPKREMYRAVCFDPADERRAWAFHVYGDSIELLGGMVEKLICSICGEETLASGRR